MMDERLPPCPRCGATLKIECHELGLVSCLRCFYEATPRGWKAEYFIARRAAVLMLAGSVVASDNYSEFEDVAIEAENIAAELIGGKGYSGEGEIPSYNRQRGYIFKQWSKPNRSENKDG